MKTAKKAQRRFFDPHQKITAVLAVWTERRTTSQICRELCINANLLNRWQNQAMEAMLVALSPKKPRPALNSRLERLITKNLPDPTAKLQQRLKAIEKAKAP